MNPPSNRFADWLNATMQSRRLSQAQLARAVGVADTQVSRWRRGHVVPTVRYLQRIADTLEVPRTGLDRLAGYPVTDPDEGTGPDDPQRQAELQAYEAQFRRLMEQRVPRPLWRAYAEACAALAESLGGSFQDALARAEAEIEGDATEPAAPASMLRQSNQRPAGFRR
ncbi:MAG: helix-turn-helix domain-containing protein [Chloroflexota bacterium]